nr:MAG TPA: tail tape measure protein [Caudoviricetes sp.]
MEIFKLLGKIVIDGADDAQNSIEKVGKAATKAGKVIAAGVGAGATAIGVLAKNAVSSYADYEQLVGGVQTLFNETELSLEEYAASVGKTTDEVLLEWGDLTSGARRVMNNADEAFRNVGLSANEYMETVTSFSASLLQSLGGDTDKAAEKADLAITDMADNANKMGTQMVLIQNAYQGFAKQNYTINNLMSAV